MRWLLLCCLGCGRIAFEPGLDAEASPDAPTDCWGAWASGIPALTTPELITPVPTVGRDHDATLTRDGLQLYFSSSRAGGIGGDDLWVATRSAPTGPFDTVAHVPSLSSPNEEGSLSTRDGLTGVLTTSRPGSAALDIYLASRSALDQPFTISSSLLLNINTSGEEVDAWLSEDGLRLYYSNYLLRVATRPATSDPFGPPIPVPGLEVGMFDHDPALSPDELLLVFTSSRTDPNPSRDLHLARRARISDAFGPPVPLAALNVMGVQDYDTAFSADGCELYWASDRNGPIGDLAIFVARVVQ